MIPPASSSGGVWVTKRKSSNTTFTSYQPWTKLITVNTGDQAVAEFGTSINVSGWMVSAGVWVHHVIGWSRITRPMAWVTGCHNIENVANVDGNPHFSTPDIHTLQHLAYLPCNTCYLCTARRFWQVPAGYC
jgi:hypothetical protein